MCAYGGEQVWAAGETVQRLPMPHLAYLTALLCSMLGCLTRGQVEGMQGLLPSLLSGVSTHLDNAVPSVRWVCGPVDTVLAGLVYVHRVLGA